MILWHNFFFTDFLVVCLNNRLVSLLAIHLTLFTADFSLLLSLTVSTHSTAGGLPPLMESRFVKMLYHRSREESAAVLPLGALEKIREEMGAFVCDAAREIKCLRIVILK